MPDYLIKTTIFKVGADPTSTERLVRAKNQARAVAHVVKDTLKIDGASVDEIVRLTKAGTPIEQAE